MATLLENDVIRESSVIANERNVVVTLGSDQTLKFKLKGMKSGEVSIGISELYTQLTGGESEVEAKPAGSLVITNEVASEVKVGSKKSYSSFLNDLRTHNAISTLDYETKAKFDTIIKSLMDNK